MRRIEEERLLKLQGTFSHAQYFSYNCHHEEGILPSSLLWHARFVHLNYDSLRLLKKMVLLVCLQFIGNLTNVMLAF